MCLHEYVHTHVCLKERETKRNWVFTETPFFNIKNYSVLKGSVKSFFFFFMRIIEFIIWNDKFWLCFFVEWLCLPRVFINTLFIEHLLCAHRDSARDQRYKVEKLICLSHYFHSMINKCCLKLTASASSNIFKAFPKELKKKNNSH